LCKALRQRLQNFLVQELRTESPVLSEDWVLTSLRQGRLGNGITYVSALPHKLKVGLPADEVSCIIGWLQQSPLHERQTLSVRSIQDWIWVCTTVEDCSTGHLRLVLSLQAVLIWLHHWIKWSALSGSANPLIGQSSIHLPSRFDGVKPGPEMSPQLLMQYLYARCHQIRQLQGFRDPQPAEVSFYSGRENQDFLGQVDVAWDQNDGRMTQSLIQIVDSLALPALPPLTLGKLALQLALAADTWLGSLPGTLNLSLERQLIARGTEEALRIILQLALGVPPQKSL